MPYWAFLVGIYLCIQFSVTYDISAHKYWHSQTRPLPITRTILSEQYVSKVDHFRLQEDDVTSLDYWILDDFYQPGGPIFLYISDGHPNGREFFSFTSGIAYNVSQEVHAALVTADLRYFWLQMVQPSLSFEDLTQLTVEQILADISFLITNIKRVLNAPAAKVVVYGPGFGGTLAVWARQKFPHLIDGAWSSSGIFSSDIFTNDAYNHFSHVIENAPPTCVNRIREAFEEIEDHIHSGNGAYLQAKLDLCNPVDHTSELDISSFYEANIEYIIDFFNTYHDSATDRFCNYMENESMSSFDAYANWFQMFLMWSECLELAYEQRIELLSEDSFFQTRIVWLREFMKTNTYVNIIYNFVYNKNFHLNPIALERQMYYLRCTQLGLFRTTSHNNNIFRANITQNYHFRLCNDIFGEDYVFDNLKPNLERVFLEYGERDPQITGVIFTNGLNDAWLPHGMLEYDQPDSIVINITNVGSAADMFAYDLEDPAVGPTLQRIREYFLWWSAPDIDPQEQNTN